MKKVLLGALAVVAGLATSQAYAADAVTLQLKWVVQGQFGGYYMALKQGFYKDEGLDVTIKPGGPDIAPEQVIAGGGADVIVDWMAGALAAREKGVKLVNIAQPFKKSGLLLICPKDTNIKTPADFKGHTLGVWFFGNEYPFYAWMNKEGIKTDGGPDGVTVLKQSFDVQPLVQKQADCISVMTYNELDQALHAGFTLDDLNVFNYTTLGNDMLADPAFKDKMVRFVRAAMKGWTYAQAHVDETAQAIIDAGGQDLDHQKYMVGEVAKLTDGSNGVLDSAAFDRTAK